MASRALTCGEGDHHRGQPLYLMLTEESVAKDLINYGESCVVAKRGGARAYVNVCPQRRACGQKANVEWVGERLLI